MIDEGLWERVSNATCDYKRLRYECIDTSGITKEAIGENAFDRYYRLSSILASIEKYVRGEIEERDLRHWAEVYAAMLRTDLGGIAKTSELAMSAFVIRYAICIQVDLISVFYPCDEDYEEDGVYGFAEEKLGLATLDHILNTLPEWSFKYQFVCINGDDALKVLATNVLRGTFAVLYLMDEVEVADENDVVSSAKMKLMIESVRKLGYKELPTTDWREEPID